MSVQIANLIGNPRRHAYSIRQQLQTPRPRTSTPVQEFSAQHGSRRSYLDRARKQRLLEDVDACAIVSMDDLGSTAKATAIKEDRQAQNSQSQCEPNRNSGAWGHHRSRVSERRIR